MKTFVSFTALATAAVFFADAPLEAFVTVACLLGLGALLALEYRARPALKLPAPSRARRTGRTAFLPPPLNVEPNRLAA